MKNTLLLAALTLWTLDARAAILTTEFFDTDPGGYVIARGDGNMSVSFGTNNMAGSFGASPLPQVDAFSITLPDFIGSYTNNNLTQIAFQMYAASVAPSYMSIILIDDSNYFTYQFGALQVAAMTGGFTTYMVDLAWSAGWMGLGQSEFETALTSIDEIQIEIARNTSAEQVYYLDNLQTLGGGGPGPGPSAVPEPNVVNLLLFIAMLGLAARRYVSLAAT